MHYADWPILLLVGGWSSERFGGGSLGSVCCNILGLETSKKYLGAVTVRGKQICRKDRCR